MQNYLCEKVFVAKIFARVGLVEGDHGHGIETLDLERRLGGDTEAKRQVIHRVDDHTLELSRLVGDTTQARLEHRISIQKLLLGIWFQPDLVLRLTKNAINL